MTKLKKNKEFRLIMTHDLSENQKKILEIMLEEKQKKPDASLITVISKLNDIFPGYLGFNIHEMANNDIIPIIQTYNNMTTKKTYDIVS